MSKEKNSRNGNALIKAIVIILAAVLLLFLAYKGGRWLETRNVKPDTRGDSNQRFAYDNLVEYEGKTYRQRKDLTTVLVMGIDTEIEDVKVDENGNGGQADFQRLIVIDNRDKKILQIQIDRDTMTEITVLGVLGNPSGTREAQICLAHSFGDGKEESCKLACDAVSNLLLGVPIDLYCAVNLDGIGEINDFVGGITVTLEDDFTSLDPTMTKGTTLTLNAQQAEYYVRNRRSIGVGTNESRMKRQQDYISKLIEKIDDLQSGDANFATDFYDQLSPYMTTNISSGRLANEVSAMKAYDHSDVLEIKGQHKIGADGYMQFFVDEKSLHDLVLNTFFEEIK